jgi:predicted glycoside hydrolase/deacetylase ChbG (UPF0249 family)
MYDMQLVAEVVARVCSELGILWIRLPLDVMDTSSISNAKQSNLANGVLKYSRLAASMFKQYGLKFTDAFIGLSQWSSSEAEILQHLDEALSRASRFGPGLTVEYMVHPGFKSRDGDDFSRSAAREAELRHLLDETTAALIHRHAFKLFTRD